MKMLFRNLVAKKMFLDPYIRIVDIIYIIITEGYCSGNFIKSQRIKIK